MAPPALAAQNDGSSNAMFEFTVNAWSNFLSFITQCSKMRAPNQAGRKETNISRNAIRRNEGTRSPNRTAHLDLNLKFRVNKDWFHDSVDDPAKGIAKAPQVQQRTRRG